MRSLDGEARRESFCHINDSVSYRCEFECYHDGDSRLVLQLLCVPIEKNNAPDFMDIGWNYESNVHKLTMHSICAWVKSTSI